MALSKRLHKPLSLGDLGITSQVRAISSGAAYDRFWPKNLVGSNPIVNNNAEVHDTLHYVGEVAKRCKGQTRAIAQVLRKPTVRATIENVFNFFYNNYQYKLDKDGVEQVREPARSWADRKKGIDCDCFTCSVSSILINLNIPHSLKIIGINKSPVTGAPYYQHIYVVVPKRPGADINVRANYWVVDPVLTRFDEEAPHIILKDHLDMSNAISGIPLQLLNGLGNATAGLGKEFDHLDSDTFIDGLGSLSGPEEVFAGFHRALRQHVSNTRRKVTVQPSSVEAVYEPKVLEGMLGELETILAGPEMGMVEKLEELAGREHLCLKPRFKGHANAIHGHDDHLYEAMYGVTDDAMLGAVTGLGKKAKTERKAAKAAAKSNGTKKGVFTKVKNAVKKVADVKKVVKKVGTKAKAATKKVGKVLKKVGKQVIKFSPVALAARAGFLLAMRTNFGKLAEKAYWGYKTLAEAKAAKISEAYWDKCVKLLARINKIYEGTLKGEASALKKAVLNGRAAKKISKQMKGMGYMGNVGDVGGLNGLGSAAAAGASITAALAFLTPIIKFMKETFKKNKDGKIGIETEDGGTEAAPSDNPSDAVNEAVIEANNPTDNTVADDRSIESAVQVRELDPSVPREENTARTIIREAMNTSTPAQSTPSETTPSAETETPAPGGGAKFAAPGTNMSSDPETTDPATDPPAEPQGGSKSNTGLIIGGLAIAAGIAAFALGGSSKKKSEKPLSGTEDLGKVHPRKKAHKKVKNLKLK